MAEFNNLEFEVRIIGDASLPLPAPDEGGFLWYEATIRCDRSTYEDLNDLLSGIDIIPAMAMRGGGMVTRRWGAGSKSLTYPMRDGAERTRNAILVSLVPTGEFLRDIIESEARWLVLGAV